MKRWYIEWMATARGTVEIDAPTQEEALRIYGEGDMGEPETIDDYEIVGMEFDDGPID